MLIRAELPSTAVHSASQPSGEAMVMEELDGGIDAIVQHPLERAQAQVRFMSARRQPQDAAQPLLQIVGDPCGPFPGQWMRVEVAISATRHMVALVG